MKQDCRVIIAGSRNFNNYEMLCEKMKKVQEKISIKEVVCGGARGADSLGARWAKENNIPVKYFLPDWNSYGIIAGIIRNHQMGDYADYLVAFWDEKSRGTEDMINYMRTIGKHGEVFIYRTGSIEL